MSLWKKLAVAATILGLISVSITWYLWSSKETEKTAINNKVVENTGQPDTLEKIVSPLPSKAQDDKLPPVPIARQGRNKNPGQRNDSDLSSNSKSLGEEKRKDLFKANFEPDLAPQDKEGPLKTALLNYENKNYSEAIMSFEHVDLGPVTRGEADDSRIILAFNMHYYKALSNMAADTNISNAISELKNALRTSSDVEWQTKTQWYLALAYLKNHEVNKAMQWLTKLANKNGSPVYQQKAIQLIKQLQRE